MLALLTAALLACSAPTLVQGDASYASAEGSCGDRQCMPPEDCHSCPADCGDCCGDGQCMPPEDCHSCPADCGDCCGDQQCMPPEDCRSCPADCGDCASEATE